MDGNHSPAEPVLKRGQGQHFLQLTRFGPQVLDLIRSSRTCRITGKPLLACLEELLRPAIVEVLGNTFLAAKLSCRFLATSERRTCTVLGFARSTLRYQTRPRNDDLRLALIRLAKQYGRYGYRKVGELLQAEGWPINHKKVARLWREEGLQLPRRHKRRKRLYHHDASVIRLHPHYPNHVWAVDFVHDRLSNGRPYKMLTVLDEYTREALSVVVAAKMGSADVLEALYPLLLLLLLKHGKPAHLRSDNGLECAAAPFQDWLRRVGIVPIHINPGSPWKNVTVRYRQPSKRGHSVRCD